eukprot:scaffold7172_cov149-Skeletonema_menzelii.AAC.8
MIGYGRGGGGGGFGGFPYRSSHQQGQDGRRGGRGRGRGRGGRQQRKQSRPRSQISIAAELNILSEHRRVIVGRGGTTLKWLKEVSGANIFVPHVQRNNRRGRSTRQETDDVDANANPDGTSPQEQVNQHPVRVNSPELSSMLHAFEEISRLLSKTSDIDVDFIPCIVKMRTNDITTLVDGKLFIQRDVDVDTSRGGRCLFSGTMRSDTANELQAYSIQTSTSFDEESVSMVIDNILFVDSSLERCHWYYKETPLRNNNLSSSSANDNDEDDNTQVRRIVFLFGSNRDNSKLFFDALKDEISSAENNAVSTR